MLSSVKNIHSSSYMLLRHYFPLLAGLLSCSFPPPPVSTILPFILPNLTTAALPLPLELYRKALVREPFSVPPLRAVARPVASFSPPLRLPFASPSPSPLARLRPVSLLEPGSELPHVVRALGRSADELHGAVLDDVHSHRPARKKEEEKNWLVCVEKRGS